MDYRWLNSLTTKDVYPLPRIDDSLRLLGNQQWSSTMELASGYWQVEMSPEATRKAAFVTNEGLFQFRVIPFGLCNAPATFERLMERVLCGMWWYARENTSIQWLKKKTFTNFDLVIETKSPDPS